MNKKNSWIALSALTLGLAGFYPAYVFLVDHSALRREESLIGSKTYVVGQKMTGDAYFRTNALERDVPTSEKTKLRMPLKEALEQAPRIAMARNLPIGAVEKIILSRIEFPTLTLLGKKWVDAAELNFALDQLAQRP